MWNFTYLHYNLISQSKDFFLNEHLWFGRFSTWINALIGCKTDAMRRRSCYPGNTTYKPRELRPKLFCVMIGVILTWNGWVNYNIHAKRGHSFLKSIKKTWLGFEFRSRLRARNVRVASSQSLSNRQDSSPTSTFVACKTFNVVNFLYLLRELKHFTHTESYIL